MIYSPSVKTGTKHSLQAPLIYTEIMEIGSTRKHGKARTEKIEEKSRIWIDTRQGGHYT